MWKMMKGRGFTDRLYFYNFCAVHVLMAAVLIITALGGILGLSDLSPLGSIPQWAYTELGIHTGFIIWKAKAENSRKYPPGTGGGAFPEEKMEAEEKMEMEEIMGLEESEGEL